MLVSITDFAKERGEQTQTVAKWIREHGFPLIENGKKKMIDTNALWYQELNEKYPLPQPVIPGIPIEEHDKALTEIIFLQKENIRLLNELTDQKLLVAEHEAQNMLLEDKQKRSEEELQKALESVSELKMRLQEEQNKTWLQKLFKK